MPVPIKYIRDEKSENIGIDYSFLLNVPVSTNKKTVVANNQDASLLFEIWKNGERNSETDSIKINNIASKDLLRLKTMGFITGTLSEVKFTRKGKIIITTMALGETSQFENKRQEKKYTEILASMDKRNKPGYRTPKFAANNSNLLNLKKI